MEIPSTQANSLKTILNAQAPLENIRTGQQLYAKVVEQLPSRNEIILQLGNKFVKVSSHIPTKIGQTLAVEVQRTTTEIILNVKQTTQSSHLVNSVLRHTLPKQLPIQDFKLPLVTLNKNLQTAEKSTFTDALLAKALQAITKQIIQTSANTQILSTPNGVKIAIQNSGNFLEAKILNTATSTDIANSASKKAVISPNPTGTSLPIGATKALHSDISRIAKVDLKANLVQLINLLKSWPTQAAKTLPANLSQLKTNVGPSELLTSKELVRQQTSPTQQRLNLQTLELLTKAEGALAKITLNQLANAVPDNTTRQSWQLEIPFYNGQNQEAMFIKIEQEDSTKNANSTENQWTVSLEMNPPNLGLIKNKLTLVDEQISSHFWTENNATGQLLRDHINILKERFHASNLTTKTLDVQTSNEPDFKSTPSANTILSEKA
ncbi:MAG: flagellar hook-length control protein FliK [Piscirickettsiaceae bacterium]|nr:MAG: flagellar hook-length control protein FliK [Piscirickettsiaceae bacterium]